MFLSALVRGRLSRLPYFLGVLGLGLVLLVALPLILGLPNFIESGRLVDHLWRDDPQAYGAAIDAAIRQNNAQTVRYVALGALTLALFATFLILSARRLHDIGRPAHYAWIALIPFVGPQALFAVLIFLPGDAGENVYSVGPPTPAVDQPDPGFATSPAGRA